MSTPIQQLDTFRRSYEQLSSYPENLIYSGTYSSALTQARGRIAAVETRLFTKLEDKVCLPFRDFDQSGTVVTHKTYGDRTLKVHLGDDSSPDPLNSDRLVGDIVTKPDPQCRFIFCYGESHRSSLLLTSTMFRRLSTYHQVMPAYIDLITSFGAQEKARDLRFGRFSEQTRLAPSQQNAALDKAGRSGRFYRMCFNLKAPSYKSEGKNIHQAAVYHSFDVINGRSLWIVTKGDSLLKDRISKDLTPQKAMREGGNFQTPISCFCTSTQVLLMLCHWSTEGWRNHLEKFEDTIDLETDDAIQGLVDLKSARRYNLKEVQALQGYEDKMNEAVVVLKLNIRVIDSLCLFYEKLIANPHFPLPRDESREDVMALVDQLNEIRKDLESNVYRAELLVKIVADRKEMIVLHLQAQTTATMEKLTQSMHQIGIISQTEAIAMRIVTVVTLLYLPATFVSTFFSTDVVHYQSNNNDSSGSITTVFSSVALQRWLEVTLPLTLLTLGLAFYFFRRSMRSRLRTLGLDKLPNMFSLSAASHYAHGEKHDDHESRIKTRMSALRSWRGCSGLGSSSRGDEP